MNTPVINGVPMMLVRMRCPSCLEDGRFLVEVNLPLAALPEVTKRSMRCKCDNHIPKIKKSTPLDGSLMSINGVPFAVLMRRMDIFKNMKTFKSIDADLT